MSPLRKTVHGRRRISALLFSLLRRLDRWLTGWLQHQRALWARKPAPPVAGAGLHFELLEPRLLLSADLIGGSLSHDAFSSAVPSDAISAHFTVHRPDSEPLVNPVRIQFYASPDSVLDADDTLVGQTDLAADRLNPGSNAITVRLDARAIAQPGRYTLIGVIDPDNAIAESDETNNQSIASSPLTLDFAVGQLPGRAPVPALDLTDADGTDLRLTIAGPGIARLTPNGSGYELSLSGTDAGTRIDLTGSGGDGRITLTGLNADSPLGSLAAPIASLTGVARFATVNTLNLGDIAAGARLEGN
ncbi:MAG TPA: CARDB domain-containing protein, partial [Candidatus Accumulibacter phosphatis]|nr:CARDB domain-containing protein [Candidatus Accumulibacter phosphatis]